MSISTPTHDDLAARRAAQARAAERRGSASTAQLFFASVWRVGLLVWAIGPVVTAIVVVAVDRFTDASTVDLASGPPSSVRIYLLIMGIILPTSHLSVHAAAGGTRRSFVRGHLLGALAISVTFGAAATAVRPLIAWVSGLLTDVSTSPWAAWRPLGPTLLLDMVECLLFTLVGMAIGAGYYRWGGGLGTLFLAAALSPLVLAGDVGEGASGPLARALGADETLASTLLALIGCLVAATLVHLALRRTPIRPPGPEH